MPARDSKGRFVKKEVVAESKKPLRDAKGRFIKKADVSNDTFVNEDMSDFDRIFDNIKEAIKEIKELLESFNK